MDICRTHGSHVLHPTMGSLARRASVKALMETLSMLGHKGTSPSSFCKEGCLKHQQQGREARRAVGLGTVELGFSHCQLNRELAVMSSLLRCSGVAIILAVAVFIGDYLFAQSARQTDLQRESDVALASSDKVLPSSSDWSKFRGDLLNTGYSTSHVSRAPTVAWSTKIPGAREYWSSPTVLKDKMYVGNSNGWLYCLNATTGDLVWSFDGLSHSIFSTPAVADNTVYFGAADRKIYALPTDDPNADGIISANEILWDYTVGPSTGGVNDVIPSSPAFKDGKLFIGAIDQYFYCFDAKSGEVFWKTWTPYHGQHAFSSSPAIYKGRVFAATGNQPNRSSSGRLYCFDETTGGILWEFDIDDITYSSPVIDRDRDRVIIANSGDWIANSGNKTYRMYALAAEGSVEGIDQGESDPHLGGSDLIWSVDTQRYVYSSPAIHQDRLFFGGSDGYFRCVDAETGKLVWYFDTPARTTGIMGSPAIADGMVFFGTSDGRLVAAPEQDPNNDGVITPDEIVWTHQTRGKIVGSPTIANGAIYLGSGDGVMYCFK